MDGLQDGASILTTYDLQQHALTTYTGPRTNVSRITLAARNRPVPGVKALFATTSSPWYQKWPDEGVCRTCCSLCVL